MFIAFTAPLALFILDVFFLGFFSLIFGLTGRSPDPALTRLRRHAKITFGGQLALVLLVFALASGLDLNSLAATKIFALLIFSSALVVPLVLQLRHHRRAQF